MERQRGERGAVVRLSPRADVVWGQREGRAACLCAAFSPHRDNEGWSSGKDVQSSLTVCVPSELRPVSSVTIQLLWPPSARHCHHGHYLSLWDAHTHTPNTNVCIYKWTCTSFCTYRKVFDFLVKWINEMITNLKNTSTFSDIWRYSVYPFEKETNLRNLLSPCGYCFQTILKKNNKTKQKTKQLSYIPWVLKE